jgi:hypothetical protein
MAAKEGVKGPQPPGYRTHTPSSERLSAVINETRRIWRTHHLEYDQTQYVVARVRRRLVLEPPRTRNRRVDRLDLGKVERLAGLCYASDAKRLNLLEFITIRVILCPPRKEGPLMLRYRDLPTHTTDV